MDVKPGYKLTDVGVIPEDWEIQCVGDAFDVCNHLRLPISQSVRERISGPYPYYGPTSIQGWINEYRVDGKFALIGEDGDHFLKWHSQSMTLFVQGKFNVNNHAHLVRGTKNLTEWFYWYFSNRDLTPHLTRQGAGRFKLTKATLLTLPCALPHLPEQKAIAEALCDADALIESLEQLVAKQRRIKHGSMQELLTGQKRLPGFAGEWEVKRLGDVVETDPANLSSNTHPEFIFNYISLDDVDSGILKNSSEQMFHSAPSRARRLLQLDDVLISTVRPNLKSHLLFAFESGVWVCSTGFCVVRCRTGVTHPYFILSHMFADEVNRQIETLLTGSNYPAINSRDVRALLIRLPSYDEQAAIATILSDMDEEIAGLEAKLAKARRVKRGMMQELLTGRIRLLEPVVASAAPKGHNWAFNEAVVISVLAKGFGSEQFPLGRKRYTKLSYLMHRHHEHRAEGYLKKAAGPYNPATKYKGPEAIAIKNGYVRPHARDKFSGFVAADKIAEADIYFRKWYGDDVLTWLEQFRFKPNDELELLATVDMAMEDLRRAGISVELPTVQSVIRNHPEWEAKLERDIFSDTNIARAIKQCGVLFANRG